MLKLFRHIRRGAGYLEGYGDHPGTGTMLFMLLMCGLAGAQRGSWSGFFGGMFFGAICILPFYIIGCVDRSKAADRDQKRLMKLIKGNENESV